MHYDMRDMQPKKTVVNWIVVQYELLPRTGIVKNAEFADFGISYGLPNIPNQQIYTNLGHTISV